ncbi:Malonyl CoA-acyl carrier protein transacylase [gamma proteobacterium IMCC1989]|nr:Malonyl CoA-acyl carrier protein transacylase [gamma proteobacterium IMCC1989]
MTTVSTLAFIFPGQGSQKLGMLAELAEKYSIVQETFAEASTVLGYDLWQLSQQGPQEALNMTERTQPLLLAASVAIWRVWQQEKTELPAVMAGHSLGEWSALVCAGVVSFTDAIRLVQLRGKYMQEAVPSGVGSMAAIIGLDDESIVSACQTAAETEIVSAVNFNSPGQVVIAGHVGAVDRAIAICKEKGAKKAMPLAVSAPFHSALLKPAADRLADEIANVEFQPPTIPVVHNVNAQIEADPAMIKQRMIEQIYHPVLWVDCVNALLAQGVTKAVECGPGKVLSGLVKRIDRSIVSIATDSPEAIAAA